MPNTTDAVNNAVIKRLLANAMHDPIMIDEDGYMSRVVFMVDLRDEALVDTLVNLAYHRNRNLIKINSTVLALENDLGRLFATNVIGLAFDPDYEEQEVAQVNANHTLLNAQQKQREGKKLADPFFMVMIWVKPGDWDHRENERLEFIPTVYTRYDCGKNKTIQNHMDALSTADNIGLTKTELTKLNTAIRSVMWGGTGSAPNPEEKARLASPVDQDRLAHQYAPHYAAYLDTIKISKSREKELRMDDRHENIQKLLRISSVLAAYLSVSEGLVNAGESHVLELVHQFFGKMARGEFEADSPISALYVFMQNPKQSRLFTKNGSIPRQKPTYMATLYCLMAYIHKQKMTVNELNQFVSAPEQSAITPSQSEVVFGTFSFTLEATSDPFELRPFAKIGGYAMDIAAE